ncbi:hypothetical protein [uncultured Psychrosphaera sp.]|nr:hypothetical protein [uncultured Psychrosphaera sp.]
MKYLILFLSLILTGCGVTGSASKANFPLLTNSSTFSANINPRF